MATSAECAAAAKTIRDGAKDPDEAQGNLNGKAARLNAAEEAVAAAIQAARDAAKAAEAAAVTARELHAEIAAEKEKAEGSGIKKEDKLYGGSPGRSRSPRRNRSPSPPPRRCGRSGGRHQSPEPRVVYHDSGSGTAWPMLDKTNYHEWSQCRLWDAVEGLPVPFREDRQAMEVIVAAVPKEMGIPLIDKQSAKEAWDAIAAARIGVDRVRRATMQRLHRDWENLGMKQGEQVEDYALRLQALHPQLVISTHLI